MKFSGAVLLWITFTLMGMKATLLLKKRVAVLEETLIFFDSLIAEIEFSKTDIISMFNKFSKEASMKNLYFLSTISSDNSFYDNWEKSVSDFSYYKSDEKEKMLQFGKFLGTTDAKSQINTINLYKTFFEKYKYNALTDYEKYGKVASLFGLFVGASVFILLL